MRATMYGWLIVCPAADRQRVVRVGGAALVVGDEGLARRRLPMTSRTRSSRMSRARSWRATIRARASLAALRAAGHRTGRQLAEGLGEGRAPARGWRPPRGAGLAAETLARRPDALGRGGRARRGSGSLTTGVGVGAAFGNTLPKKLP